MSGEPMKIHGEELKFPVDWEYRIIVEAVQEENVRQEVEKCLKSHGISTAIHEGLHSEGGRYRTLKVAVTLHDREMMNALSAELAKIEGVKFLL